MKRAKFESSKKQREFFIKAKRKLGIGAKKLSRKLGLKSRGSIESYTFARTAPPIEIIKKIERLTGLKAEYELVNGKVYRMERKFLPFDPIRAEQKLKEKFGKDFTFLASLIKSNLTIKKIIKNIRSKNYSFDNSEVSRWIGAYRTNILSKVVEKINVKEGEIMLKGHIRKDTHTLSINFNLAPLYHKMEREKFNVGLEITKERDKIRIFPLKFGRKLIKTNGAIKVLLTEKSGLKIKSNIEIILKPEDFGFSLTESIYDNDAKSLVKEALKKGFVLDNTRSTPSNHKGDLSLYLKEKNIIIEITQANSYKSSYFKIGQCFVQKLSWPNSIQFLVCKEKFLSKDSINALTKLNVKIIHNNFNKDWERNVLEDIENALRK